MERVSVTKQDILDALVELSNGQRPPLAIAFMAAEFVIRTGDTQMISKLPGEVRSELEEMVELYRRGGRVVSLFNTGEVDHTDFIGQYVSVVDGVARAGSFVVAPWSVRVP